MTIKYESEDKRIRVEEKNGQKALFVDNVIQGVCDMEGNPLSPYMVFVKEFGKTLPKDSHCLFLGGGAYILPEYFQKTLKLESWSVEKDDDVALVAHSHFGPITHTELTHHSAEDFDNGDESCLGATKGTFNFIFLDCYDKGFPEKLYCPEFITRCKTALTPKGVFAVNYGGTAVEIEAFGKMFATVFANVKVNLIAMDPDFKGQVQGVFFCS